MLIIGVVVRFWRPFCFTKTAKQYLWVFGILLFYTLIQFVLRKYTCNMQLFLSSDLPVCELSFRMSISCLVDWWWGLHLGEAFGLHAPSSWAGQWSGLDRWLPPSGWSLRAGDRGGRSGRLSSPWKLCHCWVRGVRRWRLSVLRVFHLLGAQRFRLLQC